MTVSLTVGNIYEYATVNSMWRWVSGLNQFPAKEPPLMGAESSNLSLHANSVSYYASKSMRSYDSDLSMGGSLGYLGSAIPE